VRSIDIDLRKALEFRPERGELRLGDERLLLLSRGALRALYQQLHRDLGADMTRSFLMQLGRGWGERDFETLNRLYEWDTEQDRLFAGPVSQMWEGVVHAETTTVDFDRAQGRFLVRGIWRNSFEAEVQRELSPAREKADWCMCLAGYAAGWSSAFFGQPLLAIETACVSHGAPHCTFEIRPEAEFGAEATPWRAALSRTERGTTAALQAAVEAREVELVELRRRLEASTSASEKQGEAHSAFVATMSHELRTPAAAIIGLCESLGGTTLNSSQRRSVTMLRESAESLVAIVQDILDLSQLDAKAVELVQAPLDLRGLVDEAAGAIEARARDKGLTFFVTAQDGFEGRIVGDAGRIRQIVQCLCTTAVKLTDAGAVVVTLKTSQAVAGGLRTTIEVNDTGAGIPAERLARLFDAFAHIGNVGHEASPRDGGSGLGLAICRRVARLMGGDLEIESVVGQGTTFRLWFDARPAPADKVLTGPRNNAVALAARPLHILIVEDNPVLLFLLREQLATLGQQAVATTGGREALEALSQKPFDVVFADLHMPGMDGFELTRTLRAMPLPRQPYVVAVTADAAPRQRARCLSEGFDDFAIKPLSKEGLTALLAHISQASGGPAESPAIDETALVALRDNLGSSELLLELLGTFIRDAHELVAQFTADNDRDARRAAHSLKSTSLAVGARALAAIAAAAEKGQPAMAQARAQTELGRVETALRAVRM
jgi:signal transduction histidine kinase/DNA-binding NarL/FixJ family response regulator